MTSQPSSQPRPARTSTARRPRLPASAWRPRARATGGRPRGCSIGEPSPGMNSIARVPGGAGLPIARAVCQTLWATNSTGWPYSDPARRTPTPSAATSRMAMRRQPASTTRRDGQEEEVPARVHPRDERDRRGEDDEAAAEADVAGRAPRRAGRGPRAGRRSAGTVGPRRTGSRSAARAWRRRRSTAAHASGRRSRKSGGSRTARSPTTTDSATRVGTSAPVARCTSPSAACQPGWLSIVTSGRRTRISDHARPLTALAACLSASSSGRCPLPTMRRGTRARSRSRVMRTTKPTRTVRSPVAQSVGARPGGRQIPPLCARAGRLVRLRARSR